MLLRNKRSILGIALTGLAAVMLTIPTTAMARDGDRRDRSEHRDRDRDHGDRDYRDRDHRDGDRREHRDRGHARHASQRRWNGHDARDSGRGHKYGHDKHFRGRGNGHKHGHYKQFSKRQRHAAHEYRTRGHRGDGHYARAPYYCRPCNRRFAGQHDFHGHLHGHHHIPPWKLPFLIVHNTLGWVFFG